LVVFSGGSKVSDEDLISKARLGMECGAAGLIFGRNMWQRPMENALSVSQRVSDMMRSL
jgi:class I fructose-bisphosphate aldolase